LQPEKSCNPKKVETWKLLEGGGEGVRGGRGAVEMMQKVFLLFLPLPEMGVEKCNIVTLSCNRFQPV
tara:strand:+ start:640 stop:840 length:201 start_codon:yes stop_codon:yes gene_type:complete